jgi:hypothetical protein
MACAECRQHFLISHQLYMAWSRMELSRVDLMKEKGNLKLRLTPIDIRSVLWCLRWAGESLRYVGHCRPGGIGALTPTDG